MTRHGRELGVFTACAAVVVAFLFRDAILSGAVLGQADLLYQFPPWNGHVPPGWRPGNPLLLDSPTQVIPFLIEAKAAVLQGKWPLWTNAAGAGQPFLAAFQTAVLSPFTLLAYLLPIPQALAPIAAARLLAGGIGMFVFLRSLPLGLAASAFGGMAYLLNPFSVAWLEHTVSSAAAWLPWALLTVRACVENPSRKTTAALAAVTAVALLSGHPETAFKVFLFAGAYALYPNSAVAYGLQDYRGFDAVGVRTYAGLLDVGFAFNGAFHALRHFATPHLLDLLNVKYVITPADVDAPRDRFTLVHDGASRVYRNDRVLPRAFLADEWQRLAGDDARRALRSGSFDMTRMVLLEHDLPPGPMVQRGSAAPGRATVVRYEPGRVTVETEADAARLLVLTDTFFPGWIATIDGARTEILRANYAFRAVVVPPGRHAAEFRYRPASFRVGAGLSAAGLLCAVLLVSIRPRGRRPRTA